MPRPKPASFVELLDEFGLESLFRAYAEKRLPRVACRRHVLLGSLLWYFHCDFFFYMAVHLIERTGINSMRG